MTTRTFVAIELSDEAREALTRQIARLARALPTVRWADPTSLHLTLAFLGWLDEPQLAAVLEAAGVAARRAAPFALTIAGIGSFGSPNAPRVIWAGVRGDLPALASLQQQLADELEARGFPRDVRPFAPHLTLARLKEPLDAVSLERLTRLLRAPARREASIAVECISVMKSELVRPAARYTCLQACALREA